MFRAVNLSPHMGSSVLRLGLLQPPSQSQDQDVMRGGGVAGGRKICCGCDKEMLHRMGRGLESGCGWVLVSQELNRSAQGGLGKGCKGSGTQLGDDVHVPGT